MADAYVLYQDGGAPIDLPDGAIWTFGDTFLGRTQPPGSLMPPSKHRNPSHDGAVSATLARVHTRPPRRPMILPEPASQSAMPPIQPVPPVLEYFTDSAARAACPFPYFADEPLEKRRMWPLGGVAMNGRIHLYYVMIEVTDGPGPWNFRPVGSGLAVADGWGQPFKRLTPAGDWRFPVGPSDVIEQGGWLYLFEVKGDDPGRGLRLARVRPNQIENPSAYEVYSGHGADGLPTWSSEVNRATLLLTDVAGQFSIRWNDCLGAYLCVTSSDFFHPREIALRTAASPAGPFSAPVRIPVPDLPGKKTNLIYCSFQHPELSGDDGCRVAITYCRMLDGAWELSNPEWMHVELEQNGRLNPPVRPR